MVLSHSVCIPVPCLQRCLGGQVLAGGVPFMAGPWQPSAVSLEPSVTGGGQLAVCPAVPAPYTAPVPQDSPRSWLRVGMRAALQPADLQQQPGRHSRSREPHPCGGEAIGHRSCLFPALPALPHSPGLAWQRFTLGSPGALSPCQPRGRVTLPPLLI